MADETDAGPVTEVDEAQLARLLRCDVLTVRRYVRLKVIHRERNKKFPLFKSMGDVVEYLRAMASRMGTGDAMKAGAALKEAQRRLTEIKLAKLDGQLISLPDCVTLWGDFAASAKWLFLSAAPRLRERLALNDEQEEVVRNLLTEMLQQVAFAGQLQLPTGKPESEGDDDDDAESTTVTDPEPAA